ncbi:hypothetical protein DVH24_038957 [Malus domestica]|uniref:Uncharacterized protein n=1 Tax=Malus domestica TaxID=3750 RepID=A0A498KGS3_MALDO|nr:hypothetical protein DVH24_038957 [Malus domestica]
MNAKDEDGYIALHCAAESGHVDVIKIKKGVDVEARTNKGVIALQIAESLHYVGITRILIHRGATKDNKEEIIKGGMKKKKSSRARALRGSFDRSMPLVVV